MGRQENLTYAQADAAFYEAMRINKGKSNEWSRQKEGNALIDSERTPDNYELVPHHESLSPSNFRKHNRGNGIADYHKGQTGRSARMRGTDEQKSKAVGFIITLPKTYLCVDYELTDEEYKAVEKNVESGSKKEPNSSTYKSALEKVKDHKFTQKEKQKINEFFSAALIAWKKVAGIRGQDVLYAIVHMDESYPHLHIMALPTIEKEKGEITYSTSKYNNRKTHYFDKLHENLILEMQKQGIDASGILNGATKDKGFKPADFSYEQREEGVRIATQNAILNQKKEKAKEELVIIESERAAEEKKLEKARISRVDTALSKKDYKKHMKELKRVRDESSQPHLVQYEYENLLNDVALANDLKRREKELAERERNFNATMKEEARKILPEELQSAREDREYVDKWRAEAKQIEVWSESLKALSQELAKREVTAEKRENYFRETVEKEVEKEVEIRLQDRIKEVFKELIKELFKVEGFMMYSMKKWMPFDVFERFERFIWDTIEHTESKFIASTERQGDVKKSRDVIYECQDMINSIEDGTEDLGFEKD